MKTPRVLRAAVMIPVLIIASCQHNAYEDIYPDASFHASSSPDAATTVNKASPGTCNAAAYEVVLESKTFTGGQWEWIWSIRNANPGNGLDGTARDLSHWSMDLGTCINDQVLVGAAYSGDGTNWTEFSPQISTEPSISCASTPVLKFDFGTTGTQKSYYRLVLNQDFSPATSVGYYKAGQLCCSFAFAGVSCSGPVELEIVE
jgi:hypothetical protein